MSQNKSCTHVTLYSDSSLDVDTRQCQSSPGRQPTARSQGDRRRRTSQYCWCRWCFGHREKSTLNRLLKCSWNNRYPIRSNHMNLTLQCSLPGVLALVNVHTASLSVRPYALQALVTVLVPVTAECLVTTPGILYLVSLSQ